MAFWGVEVKPGKPFTLKSPESSGIRTRLHLSQATLGLGTATVRSILQCNVGNKSPLFLCVLSPGKVDSCQLNLEFQEAHPVIFSVIGPRSVHLTGYFLPIRSSAFIQNDEESDSFGEDIVDTDIEKASSDDYDYSDSFINDDDPCARRSHVSSTDDDEISMNEMAPKSKGTKRNGKARRLRKKFQVSESDSDEISVRADDSSSGDSIQVLNKLQSGEGLQALGEANKIPKVLSAENSLPSRVTRSKAKGLTRENAEPNAKSENSVEARTHTHSLYKREDELLGDVEKGCETPSKKKTKKERSKSSVVVDSDNSDGKTMPETLHTEKPATDRGIKSSSDVLPSENGDATEPKKRKRDRREETTDVKKKLSESETKKQAINKNTNKETGTKKPLESEVSSKGVITEEIEKGNLDGKAAVKGKKVSILYSGRLKDTGKLVESNLEVPLRFRLGKGKVIEGLSNGVEGMRVGDKRRLIIPPHLGFPEEGLKDSVPKNAWLVYEVEAVKTR